MSAFEVDMYVGSQEKEDGPHGWMYLVFAEPSEESLLITRAIGIGVRVAVSTTPEADSASAKEEENEGYEGHPESWARYGLSLHVGELVDLVLQVSEESNVDGESDERQQSGKEGRDGCE